MSHRGLSLALAVASLGLFFALPARAEQKADVRCELTYSLGGWSFFYKTGKGTGSLACDNGQSANVKISVKGGGITFGKSEIVNGKGTITGVKSIEDVFGGYGSAGAHAGAVESAGAQVLTKGNVSLALAGTGKGVDIGIDVGSFEIKRAE